MLLLTSLEQGNRGRYTHTWAIWILRAFYPPLVLGVILRKGSLLYISAKNSNAYHVYAHLREKQITC